MNVFHVRILTLHHLLPTVYPHWKKLKQKQKLSVLKKKNPKLKFRKKEGIRESLTKLAKALAKKIWLTNLVTSKAAICQLSSKLRTYWQLEKYLAMRLAL